MTIPALKIGQPKDLKTFVVQLDKLFGQIQQSLTDMATANASFKDQIAALQTTVTNLQTAVTALQNNAGSTS